MNLITLRQVTQNVNSSSQVIEKTILDMADLDGRCVCLDNWKLLDHTNLQAYLGLLILAGVFKFQGEAPESLWWTENGMEVHFF